MGVLIALAALVTYGGGQNAAVDQQLRSSKRLSLEAHEVLANMNDLQKFTQLLAPIMVRRIPGTPQHAQVRKHIIDSLERFGFTVATHDFTARVPAMDNFISGQDMPFSNIVATFHPNAPRRMVFACHYDSKYFNANSNFIGAIDSAVPCAMLLDMARTLGPALGKVLSPDVTLQLIFFDGEEAFKDWSATDSLYGSRALAQLWQQTGVLPQIDVMVLLDLLGTELGECQGGFFRNCPQLASYMSSTQLLYDRLIRIEETMSRRKLFVSHPGLRRYFQTEPRYGAQIEDDHVPFMRRGVPILHAITVPFPETWHKNGDNAESLHWPTIQNLNTAFRALAADDLGLDV
jgi:glutaminyl-peptide cyclotransferase